MSKVVIYTSTFGKNHGVVPQKKMAGVDFICFTDDVSKVEGAWTPVLLKNDELDSNHLRNRHSKLLPHLYFKEYEISIYIDSNYLIIGDVLKLIAELKDFKMAIFDHNQADDARDCIYDEYDAILELGKKERAYKDDPKIMKEQLDFFRDQKYPKNNGLIFAAVLIRRHNDKEVIKMMEDWWNIVSSKSKRDQLSFDYIAWKNNFKPIILEGDLRKGNPYFYYLANARRSYTKKIILYKIFRFFGFKMHQ
ncbi:MAG: DUF616 domain-containing protein [Flavobacteriaceae bacterium]|nr:DUF616 domain-containing protein [Flavobacteriaceae bacterium]